MKEVIRTLIENLPEFNKIVEYIDLDKYSGTIQTDNRLKIVHFENDGLVFNQII